MACIKWVLKARCEAGASNDLISWWSEGKNRAKTLDNIAADAADASRPTGPEMVGVHIGLKMSSNLFLFLKNISIIKRCSTAIRFIVARLLRKSSRAHLTNTHSHTHTHALSVSLPLMQTHAYTHSLSLAAWHTRTCGVYVSVYDKRFLPNDIDSDSIDRERNEAAAIQLLGWTKIFR